MTKISTESIKKFQTVIGEFNTYKERYEQLKAGVLKGTSHTELFAEPFYNESKGEISWYTSKTNFYKLADLSEDEKRYVVSSLQAARYELMEKINKFSERDKVFYTKIFDIPGERNIYAVREGKDLLPVVTMWGSMYLDHSKGTSGGGWPSALKTVNICVKVLDTENRPLSKVDVQLNTPDGFSKIAKSNEKGIIPSLGELPLKQLFTLTIPDKNLTNDFVADKRTFYELRVTETPIQEEPEVVAPPPYSLTLFDKKKQPIPNQQITLETSEGKSSYTTEEQGVIRFEGADVGQKIKTTANYKGKNYKKTIDYKPSQQTYTLTLKKRNFKPLWYLLMGLLTLAGILLIPFDNQVRIKVVNSLDKLEVEDAKVDVNYFYDNDEQLVSKATTDEMGFATLKLENKEVIYGKSHKHKEPLYSKLFMPYPKGNVFIVHPCHEEKAVPLDSLSKWRRNKIELTPAMKSVEFVVENKNDKTDKIPLAIVTVESTYNGNPLSTYVDTTNFGGTVTISEIPLCSEIRVTATKQYHSNDTIGWVNFSSLQDSVEQRTLKLIPAYKMQKFYVRSTTTKKGLPGALVKAHVELENNVLDTIRRVADIEGIIKIPAPYNTNSGEVKMWGELTGYEDSTYYATAQKINRFRNVKDSMTLWLRPKPFELTITVIDTLTMHPISGANVNLSCNGSLTSSGLSDINGEVYLGGTQLNCSLQLDASHSDYIPKTIKDKTLPYFRQNLENRKIYLKPKPPKGEKPKDCGGEKNYKDRKAKTETYYLKKSSGTFNFDYNTDSLSDRIQVFNSDGRLLWEFEGATGTWRSVKIDFDTPYITVKVKGSTIWYYTVNCPT